MSDGETVEEAIANSCGAFEAWIGASKTEGLLIPDPGEGVQSGRFIARVPGSLSKTLMVD